MISLLKESATAPFASSVKMCIRDRLLHAADAVFRQEVAGFGDAFQILDGRPMAVARALLCLDVVLNINEQADLSTLVDVYKRQTSKRIGAAWYHALKK